MARTLTDNPTAPAFVRFRQQTKLRPISKRSLRTCGRLFLDNQRGYPMTKPIPDKAEIALEYPDKLYVGTFERSSRFEAHLRSNRHCADPRTTRC